MNKALSYLAMSLVFYAWIGLPHVEASGNISPKSMQGSIQTQFYSADLVAFAQAFIASTTPRQRQRLVQPFVSIERTKGTDTSATPSFCASLSWCVGWGIQQCELDNPSRTALHKMLSVALSSSGYQMLLAVLNRQRIIGELEDQSTTQVLNQAKYQFPNAQAPSIFNFDFLAPQPLSRWYPAVGGYIKPRYPGDLTVDWSWNPPGLQQRYKDFCNYSVVFLGNPGDEKWALRFEGHHISVNMTFIKHQDTYAVHATPLFIGAFPMVIPEAPKYPVITQEWLWQQGQTMLFEATYNIRQFWQSLPESVQKSAFQQPGTFSAGAPLLVDTPPPFLISGLATQVDPKQILKFSHVIIDTTDLSEQSKWYLTQAFSAYTQLMHPSVGAQYRAVLQQKLATGARLTLSWSGEPNVGDLKGHHYSYLLIDDFLLLEFLQSNQFSVQHAPQITGNHIHGILRDLSFDWSNPMEYHHHLEHNATHRH